MFPPPPVDLADWHQQTALWLYKACEAEQVDGFRVFHEQRQAATAAMMRTAARLHEKAPAGVRDFVGDDLALAMGVAPMSGRIFVQLAVEACGLPGLVETVESGELTDKHVGVVVTELGRTDATPQEREAIVAEVRVKAAERGRRRGCVLSPSELGRLVQTVILLRDVQAAEKRRVKATAERGVFGAASRDGQGYLSADGPVEKITVMMDAIRARAEAMGRVPGDDRSLAQREFDACYELLTAHADGGQLPTGQNIRGVQVQVIVPFSTAQGGDLELAEIPGFGPILPATARELLHDADTLRRVAVDEDGRVLAVDDAVPGPGRRQPAETATEAPADEVEDGSDKRDPAAGPPKAARVRTPPQPKYLLDALKAMATSRCCYAT